MVPFNVLICSKAIIFDNNKSYALLDRMVSKWKAEDKLEKKPVVFEIMLEKESL
jgi:hypothetical protein